MNHTGFTIAKTLTEVALSKEVIIMDIQNLSIAKQGTYKDLKDEWTTEIEFYKRLREMLELKLVHIKNR